MSTHAQLVGLDLHEPYHYIQEADPGAVGAKLYWLQISTGTVKRRNDANAAWVIISPQAATATFLSLSDTPSTYTGQAGKSAVVNGAENALEFATITGGSGAVLQMKYAESTTLVNVTTPRIPYDNTIPQNTEGTEILTCSITPTSSASYLVVHGNINFSTNNTSCSGCVATFRDSTANCLDARLVSLDGTASNETLDVFFRVLAGSTSATTFKFRVSTETGTMIINPAYFGGVNRSALSIAEVAP